MYAAVLADLEAKRDHLNGLIESLRTHAATQGIPLPSSAKQTVSSSEPAEISHDAFFGMALPEAAKKYLSIVKATKTNAEVGEALTSNGFKTQSKNFSEVVRSTLSRHPDFVRVNGQLGLAEWYGGRNIRKPRRTNSAETVANEEQDRKDHARPEGD